ncbi:MAG: hypothetical protein JNL82_06725 [Myxococcales bacterium]|nr:hypothetical protein [Myxococcales bacterium]
MSAADLAATPAAAVAAESVPDLALASMRAAVAAADPTNDPHPEMSLGTGAAIRESALTVTVRSFFSQVAASAPGGLDVDFAAWETAKVERFFLALHTLPGRRRGPALTERAGIDDAFADFQWD